jgi:hypothetical protein
MKILLAHDNAERAGALAGVIVADTSPTVLHLDPSTTLADAVLAHAPDMRRIGEPDAYKWLRRTAMSKGRCIIDIATDVIRESEGPRE